MRDVSTGSLRDQSTIVAKDVNWTVMAGDYWMIAGLQGAGKSDFLMMTAGLMAPAAGSYTLLGEPMPIFDEPRIKHRLRLGLVFETGQLFNHLTVMENIVLALRYHEDLPASEAKERVKGLLEVMETRAVGRQHTRRDRAELAEACRVGARSGSKTGIAAAG